MAASGETNTSIKVDDITTLLSKLNISKFSRETWEKNETKRRKKERLRLLSQVPKMLEFVKRQTSRILRDEDYEPEGFISDGEQIGQKFHVLDYFPRFTETSKTPYNFFALLRSQEDRYDFMSKLNTWLSTIEGMPGDSKFWIKIHNKRKNKTDSRKLISKCSIYVCIPFCD